MLCNKGEEGYVVNIGTFLQQFYIYGVEFIGSGHRVGMKRKELELVDAPVDDASPEALPGNAAAAGRVTSDRAPSTDLPMGSAGIGRH